MLRLGINSRTSITSVVYNASIFYDLENVLLDVFFMCRVLFGIAAEKIDICWEKDMFTWFS